MAVFMALSLCLRLGENMQGKKLQYRGYLIAGLVITFLLVGNITYTDAQGEYPATLSTIQHESEEGKTGPEQTIPSEISKQDVSGIEKGHKLGKSNSIEETQKGFKDINSHTSLQLGLRLAGTVLLGKEHSFAVIVDKKTGKQRLYRLGQSVKGITILKIGRESILVEKEGMTQVLRVTRGNIIEEGPSKNRTENGPPSIGVSEMLPTFEPVVTVNGPPSIGVSEQLPPFKPVVTEYGPPSIGESKELPHFEPITLGSSPPVFDHLDGDKGN